MVVSFGLCIRWFLAREKLTGKVHTVYKCCSLNLSQLLNVFKWMKSRLKCN